MRVTGPTEEEYEERMPTHIPFRNWCEFCVKGKRKGDPHKENTTDQNVIDERRVPVIGLDYTFPRDKKENRVSDQGMPILVMKNSADKWASAFVVPQKGIE